MVSLRTSDAFAADAALIATTTPPPPSAPCHHPAQARPSPHLGADRPTLVPPAGPRTGRLARAADQSCTGGPGPDRICDEEIRVRADT
jgi:hypothetical protein